jgi:glutaredoxin
MEADARHEVTPVGAFLNQEQASRVPNLSETGGPQARAATASRSPAMALQLYHRWHCPYSKRVRDYIEQQGLGDRIAFVEIGEVDGAEAELEALTGHTQVPCLVIDGTPKLESRDIVAWLEANLAGGGAAARP